jgi:hypothetical protein
MAATSAIPTGILGDRVEPVEHSDGRSVMPLME